MKPLFAATTLALAGLTGCPCTPSQAEIDRAYQAEVGECASRPGKEEAMRCRSEVKARWGVDSGSD